MRRLTTNSVATLLFAMVITGCGRPTYVVLDADQKYYDALEADVSGDQEAAIALLD